MYLDPRRGPRPVRARCRPRQVALRRRRSAWLRQAPPEARRLRGPAVDLERRQAPSWPRCRCATCGRVPVPARRTRVLRPAGDPASSAAIDVYSARTIAASSSMSDDARDHEHRRQRDERAPAPPATPRARPAATRSAPRSAAAARRASSSTAPSMPGAVLARARPRTPARASAPPSRAPRGACARPAAAASRSRALPVRERFAGFRQSGHPTVRGYPAPRPHGPRLVRPLRARRRTPPRRPRPSPSARRAAAASSAACARTCARRARRCAAEVQATLFEGDLDERDLGAPRGGADLRRRRRPHDRPGRRGARARGRGGRARRRRGADRPARRAARRSSPAPATTRSTCGRTRP